MSSRIETIHLFPKLDDALVTLLRSLSKSDWERPTIAGKWRIKDVAAHLLDGFIRTLSFSRDRYCGETAGEVGSYADLVNYLNRLNADWVTAMRRVSPAVLTEWIFVMASASTAHLETLDMEEPAVFPVAWAGQDQSPNWFHVAREYTERWHHQQQIRLALGKDSELLQKYLYMPFLETCLRALPYHFRDVPASVNDAIRVRVLNMGTWDLNYDSGAWHLSSTREGNVRCTIEVPSSLAWRIFMNGLSPDEARHSVTISGNPLLGVKFLAIRSVTV